MYLYWFFFILNMFHFCWLKFDKALFFFFFYWSLSSLRGDCKARQNQRKRNRREKINQKLNKRLHLFVFFHQHHQFHWRGASSPKAKGTGSKYNIYFCSGLWKWIKGGSNINGWRTQRTENNRPKKTKSFSRSLVPAHSGLSLSLSLP